MPQRTQTRSVETHVEPEKLLLLLTQVEKIPRWAPVFADTIQHLRDAHWLVTKSGETFEIEVIVNEASGTVDYLRQLAEGKRGGAYIRVVPRPFGGSSVSMTLPVAGQATPDEVAMVLEKELTELIRLGDEEA